jgi:hypothetical protein
MLKEEFADNCEALFLNARVNTRLKSHMKWISHNAHWEEPINGAIYDCQLSLSNRFEEGKVEVVNGYGQLDAMWSIHTVKRNHDHPEIEMLLFTYIKVSYYSLRFVIFSK